MIINTRIEENDNTLARKAQDRPLWETTIKKAMRSPQLNNVEDIKSRRIGHQRELPWCNDDDDKSCRLCDSWLIKWQMISAYVSVVARIGRWVTYYSHVLVLDSIKFSYKFDLSKYVWMLFYYFLNIIWNSYTKYTYDKNLKWNCNETVVGRVHQQHAINLCSSPFALI